MGIVIVEGCDASGKSSLIEQLRLESNRYFWVLRGSGPPKTYDEIDEAISWITRSAHSGPQIICDRHPLISEPIYGMTLRGRNLLEGHYSEADIRAHLLDSVDRIIYCRPPLEEICKKVGHQAQLKGVIDNLERLVKVYDQSMQFLKEEFGMHVLTYDYTQPWAIGLEALFFGRI